MAKSIMSVSRWLRDLIARQRAISHDYGAVQDEAAVESMRRILVTFWFFGPIEVGLAIWYWNYNIPAGQPAAQYWADSLCLVHTLTATLTLVLGVLVSRVLRRHTATTRTVTTLQVLMSFTYLMYGITVSYFDIAVGGVEAFILICFGVAGLSLMRPVISVALFGVTYAAVWQMLLLSDEHGQQLDIMRFNSLTAVILAVILSAIIYHQYAKGLLLRRALEVIAGQDALTLLPNRRELMDRLRKALYATRRNGKSGAVLFIDLDHFKNINDTRGHNIGDLLLKEVALRLVASVREADTVARLGGDEFVVMLEDLDSDINVAARQSEVVSEKIIRNLNQPYFLADAQHHSTPSIGVALFSLQETTVDEVMKRADMAMYQAKDAGRNTVQFFDAEMQIRLQERTTLEDELRNGIASEQLVLHYQAQVDAHGTLLGAEALVRWHHPSRGLVPPGHFIPLAEEVGLILPLGNWVLNNACTQLANWAGQAHTSHLTMSVNVSSNQFHQPDFVVQVRQTLAHTGANPHRLKLELTESLMVSNVDDVICKMNLLSALGIRISLDDFGTGYSSLTYLKRLPLHQLKIDQSFVQDISNDANGTAIASAIITLSQKLGLNVIAEGVETALQRDYLVSAGCQSFQGYFFGRPIPIAAFEALRSPILLETQ
jgi:diguanylate cyclase (GGDEF)-like protein